MPESFKLLGVSAEVKGVKPSIPAAYDCIRTGDVSAHHIAFSAGVLTLVLVSSLCWNFA